MPSAAAVALLASVVGRSVEQLGDRFGPDANQGHIVLFTTDSGPPPVVDSW